MQFSAKIFSFVFLITCAAYMPAEAKKSPTSDAAISEKVSKLKFDGIQFAECKAVGILENDTYSKDKKFWDHAINECGVDVQVLPSTSWFKSFLGKMGGVADQKEAADFLVQVGLKAKGYVETNNNITAYLLACAEGNTDWFTKTGQNMKNCPRDIAAVKKRVAHKRGEMRAILALTRYEATTTPEVAEFQNRAHLNEHLYAIGITAPKMEMLSEKERREIEPRYIADTKKIDERYEEQLKVRKERAKEMLDKQMSEVRVRNIFPDVYAKDPRKTDFYRRFRMAERRKIQEEYKDKYNEHIADLPVLMYMAKENPTDKDVADALKKVLENGKSELAKINKLLTYDGTQPLPSMMGELDAGQAPQAPHKADFSDLTEMMKYGPVIKEILKKNPQACGVATGIANHLSQKELSRMGAILVGTIGSAGVASIYGPAVLGVAATTANSVMLGTVAALPTAYHFTSHDIREWAATERRTLNVVDTTDGAGHALGDMKDLNAARDMATLSLAMTPLDIFGLGVGKAALGLAKGGTMIGAAAVTGKLLERQGAQQAIRSSLQAKGIGKAEADALLRDLKSNDNVVASKAGANIVKTLGLDPEEIAMVRLAAKKSLLSADKDDPLKYINLLMKDLPEGVAERKIAVRKALEILDKTNAAKINEKNRREVVKATAAAANFGYTDPAHIARVVTEWDQGLDGLAKVFNKARLKLQSHELASIPSQTERQERAFAQALREEMDNSPEFRAMSKSEREAAERQMTACATGRAS